MKHKFIAKRYWVDQATAMGEVDALSHKFSNVIDLSLGDPDLITDRGIIDFAFTEALKGHTKYTDFRGDPELRDEIREFYKDEFKVNLKDDEIMVSTSGCLGMYLALESILDPGDEVIIHSPYFTPYYQQIKLANGVPIELDTFEEDGFQINIANLKNVITERTKAIIINSPNNPTGAIFSLETLQEITEVAIEHDLVIISDEIYGSYAFYKEFHSLITFREIKDRLIVINSFSKDYTMTGWRIGNIIAPHEIIKTCQAVNENVVFTAPSISQRGALYALRNRHSIQPPMLNVYLKRVEYATERINQISWMSLHQPEGTFYLFINIKQSGQSSESISNLLLEKAQVLSIPGTAFGSSGEGYIRIACTVNLETLKEAFDRIERIQISKDLIKKCV